MKFVIGGTLTILSWANPVTAFFRKSKKLRHSLGRPSRSDFVQFEFAGGKTIMKKYRKLSICISVLNAIGIVCLFYCAALYLSHDTYVVNPDTMLPMMNWERGGMMLTMGVMPMLIANTLGFLYILKKGTSIIKRLLFFIPSILEVILVLHYWISSLLA
ncbi:MAG: hypothetical protein PUI38_00035 [Candidatus Treponema excrementipullorum]|nr:hypothetical protein [Candidatus Treponema excrementipullorum]